jgi:hypothetical protein
VDAPVNEHQVAAARNLAGRCVRHRTPADRPPPAAAQHQQIAILCHRLSLLPLVGTVKRQFSDSTAPVDRPAAQRTDSTLKMVE